MRQAVDATMRTRYLRDGWGSGLVVWAMGFLLGAILLPVVPERWFDLVLLPPLVVLVYTFAGWRFSGAGEETAPLLVLGSIWLVVSLVLDNIVIVRLLGEGAFYDFDVVLYYAFLVIVPTLASRWPLLRRRVAPDTAT